MKCEHCREVSQAGLISELGSPGTVATQTWWRGAGRIYTLSLLWGLGRKQSGVK